jgi:hypothetical protein
LSALPARDTQIQAFAKAGLRESTHVQRATLLQVPSRHRKGDIVAGENGLVVASPATGRHAAANFTPLPPAMQARFRHLPVVARE